MVNREEERRKPEDETRKEEVEEREEINPGFLEETGNEENAENIKGNEKSCQVSVGRGRDRYGTRQGLTRVAAVSDERCTCTQASCTDDVTDKNDGHQVKAEQDSINRVMCMRGSHRRVTVCTQRTMLCRVGTPRNQAATVTKR